MANRQRGFAAGALAGLLIAGAAAAGAGLRWPQAVAADPAGARPDFSPPAGAPLSFADIFEKVAPAVVSIDVTTHLTQKELQEISPFQGLPLPFGNGPRSPRGGGGDDDEGQDASPHGRNGGPKLPEVQASGSGFFISPEGYILTNNHVVENADTIKVTLNDKRELTARVIGRDEGTDLAVVKVDGGPYPYVSFEDRLRPRVGDWVLAIGNPLGLGGTATAGIISTIGRNLRDASSTFVDYIQIDAPINRGNSGGPTFDIYGRVIGVNTAIYSPNGGSIGIGFDIPADIAQRIARQLIEHGKVTRGYLGVTIQNVTPDIAESLGLKPDTGALVSDVVPGGPGDRAGMKAGDIVLKVDGHPVTTNFDLTRQVAMAQAGEILHLTVLRDGRTLDVDVRSGVRPSESQLAQNLAEPDEGGPGGDSRREAPGTEVLGMRLGALTDAARQKYNLQPSVRGVLIEGVKEDSEAGETGLRAGDVIVRAGERAATTPADVQAAISAAKAAGRKGVFMLVAHDGRNIGISLKFDTPAAGAKAAPKQ